MRCAEPNVFLGWCFEKSEIAVFRLGYEPLSTTGGIKGGTNRAASSSHKWGGIAATENGHELQSVWTSVWTWPCADEPDGL